ncbi:WPP domain-interacting tail-anchored protein 1 [Punica granatum]|uniref:WPP domain-interacting tail-anchored protein 1 n=2 Tax=Punica granatum TaxID=22663 RepID=A0A6P8D7J5_PUNGR|nr:WPP domain-interacting tail-anchored protein 1 [Punica granatum]XP_031393088.1 WPP domain-interacting tail-anchored protein 1 [Punica granatum]PKI69871.1 hypothetical protein CRG98_009746 [Punica granatum]
MDSDPVPEASVSVDDVETTRSELGSSNVDDTGLVILSDGELNGDIANAQEALTRIELDLACASEKLCNLNILMMHVATKEGELEAFDSVEEGEKLFELIGKALQFDFLSGFLSSEVRELDSLLNYLKRDILDARQLIPASENLGRDFIEMEEKLCDSEKTLDRLQEQVIELLEQSDTLQKALTGLHAEETGEMEKSTGLFMNVESMDTKNKMQTAEQQRHFLRMLEKSLARELDLEKKVSESRLIEEELKLRLQSAEQEVFCLEEEMVESLERFFQADNASEVLLGISKELLGRLQILQFNLNSSAQREADLRLKLEDITEKLIVKDDAQQKLENSLKASLKEAEDKLVIANSEISALKDTVSPLERQIEESRSSGNGSQEQLNRIEDLTERLSKSEAQCKLLTEKNLELERGLAVLKGCGITPEKVNLLEKRLRESDILLQHAVASAEASEEKQKMLYSAIEDMENIIEDLKGKVSKAEHRADSAEHKCILLSETNAELNEELSFLRNKMEFLEGSLTRAEETKMTNAKDVRVRAGVMANLVMQLAMERERLHKQISSLVKDNKVLVVKLHQTSKDSGTIFGKFSSSDNNPFPAATSARDLKEEVTTESLATSNKVEENVENTSTGDQDLGDSISQLDASRRIDAGVLSFKHVVVAALILLMAAAASQFFYQ